MVSIERMTALAKVISEKTAIVTNYLKNKGHEAPSFDVNGLDQFPIPPEDEVPFKAWPALAAATNELHNMSLGPKEGLRNLAWDPLSTCNMGVQVAQAVPLQGTISYGDLTTRVEALNDGLLIGVAHTRASRLLLEDEPLRNWVGFMCNDLWLPMTRVVHAMKKWLASGEPTETSVNLAYKNLPRFDFLQQDTTLANRYNLDMQAHGGAERYSVEHVVHSYPWGNWEDATVVDMGGNQGYISFAIAEAFPKLKFIVQDQAGMRTPETMGKVPDHLAERVRLTTHDFFAPQTEVTECYFLRMIFHGFSDKYSVRILQALVPALRKGSLVVINDGALPEPGTVCYLEERAMRTLDLFMQVTVNAREPEADDDWAALFARADPRYRLKRVWKPENSVMWFIEAEWTGDRIPPCDALPREQLQVQFVYPGSSAQA
ncbi:6-hydroxytryprostatin B O-methyltransferase [Madurella mycetomatis]|uniref:6-hydroxytryprostatin B O-methyltransferase n=1 Tax=Madurella mycetomatis TaxID=100816 RepID=A0A175VT92_9PEZI|nr:6-hydroxytryprostatin B O-methyltransferase [Madurella mycetomatis]